MANKPSLLNEQRLSQVICGHEKYALLGDSRIKARMGGRMNHRNSKVFFFKERELLFWRENDI